MENHLTKMYSQAKRDVGREWYKYMESIKPEADRLLKAYEDAKLTDDKDLIKKTGKEYGQFLRQQTYMNERYKSMLNTTTTKLANVNETALSYLNGKMPKIYATNYNQVSEDIPSGISFDLVDETTVKNLVKDNPKLLPTKKLDIPKDKRWNQKAINSQVLQSIIQGESITKMAKRLTPIMDRNHNSAIRNARTMTTGAQNKGRLDSYKTAQDKGIVLHKVWMATNSDRTRAWHADLDGAEVEIDEPFENDYGKIMFPGDPTAHPGNVYNCRCTLTTKIIGFKRADGSIKYIEGEEPKNVNRKDVSDTQTRRSYKFDFGIEHAVERLRNSVGDSYEYHCVNNGLNVIARDDLSDDFFTVKLTKMDDDVRESFVSQFEHLSSKYDTTVQEIRPMEKMEYLSKKDSFAFVNHDYDFDKSVLVYNPVKINEVSRIKEIVKNGYATQINEELANKYVITHEFAHTLIDMGSDLNPSRNFVGADYKRIKSIRKEIDEVYDKYINEIGALDKAKKAAELDALTTLNEDSWKKSAELAKELKAKSLGKYSLVNSDEFMAECFTHHELGGARNDYVDMIMNIINKHFRRRTT